MLSVVKNKMVRLYQILNRKEIETAFSKTVLLNKDQFYGKRCFIVGGGPSINEMDLSYLNGEYTACVNRGFLLKDKGMSKVSFYGCSDHSAMAEYMHNLPSSFYEHLFLFRDLKPTKKFESVSYFSAYTGEAKGKSMYEGFFQFSPNSQPCAHSYTVVLYMLQIVVWLGFKDIYFIGVDNNFNSSGNNHWYQDSDKEKKNMQVWDFDPCESNEESFRFAHELLKEKGVNIYNAGIGGNLKSIPRVCYDELFREKVRAE